MKSALHQCLVGEEDNTRVVQKILSLTQNELEKQDSFSQFSI